MNANFSAHIGARITEFMAQMRQVQATIRTTANDVRVDVGADVSEFNRRMAEIRARIAALVRERVIIRIETRIQEFQNSINRIATNIRAFGELAQHTIQGTMISLLPAVVPLLANIGVAIANLGPMIGTVAGSTFALVGAFAAAGAGAVAFGAVAIPTIKNLFDESAKLTAQQASAKASFDAFKKTYDGLVKATEQPVLSAFQGAMTAANTVLKALQPLFVSSAQAVDGLMKSLNQSIGTPPVQAFLQYLNNSGASMLTTFGQAFGNVFKGLGSMLVAFAPLSASTAQGFLEMTQRFAEWANGLSASAKFQAFIDYVNTNMPKVRAIFRDMTAGLIYFFSAFAGSSQGMMDGLVNMMARFKEWSRTLSENQGFQQFVGYVQQTVPSVLSLIGNLTTFLVNLGIGMAPLGATILNLVNRFLEFANSMMENNRIIGVLIAGFISFGGVMLAVLPNVIALSTLFKGLGTAITSGLGRAFTFIMPLFTNFSATVARITTAVLPGLSTALGLITSPVGLVIAAIVALTAVFVGLYKTNDTFRAQVQEVWSVIQKAISVSVNAIKDVVMNVWNQITSFWNQNQESIKATASTVWNVIGNVVTTVMSAIGAIMQAVWPVVKTIIVSTWEAIKNVIEGATKVILGIVKTFTSLFEGDWKGVWEGIKSILSGALQAVWGAINLYFVGKLLAPIKGFATAGKSVIQAAWEAIKSIFTNTLNAIKTLVSTVFNGIKNTITTIWNGIKSFISTILNAIKSTMSTIWQSIRNTLDQVLTSIRGLITSIWNGIKSTITTVLNGIKSVVSSVWNSIKSVVSSVVNGIKDTITTIWNGIKDVISTTMSTIKSTIETKWNEAKAFLTSINLLSVGKDIIAGLISGITSKFGEVASALSSLTDKIPSWVKSALGIHSPSRVMADIAQWIPIGMAKGIDQNTSVVRKAMSDMAVMIEEDAKETEASIVKLKNESADKLAKIETDNAYSIRQIQLKASAAKRELTQAEKERILKLEADAASKAITIQEQYAEKIRTVQEKADAARFESVKSFIDNKKDLEDLNLVQEARIWQESLDLFEEGTAGKIKAQKEYKAALEKVNDELAKINEKYANKVIEINKELATQEEKLTKEYEDAFREREKSLLNFAGTFDSFEVKIDKTGSELLANLDSQVKGFKVWQEQIDMLSTKAIDEGLLAELRAMGPQALGELQALNSLSDTELTKYSELYREKAELARTQTEKELAPMKDDTSKQIKLMRDAAIIELESLQKDWVSEINGLTSQISTSLSSLEQIGRDAVAGLIAGIESKHVDLESTVTNLASVIENTTRSVLDTHSPSKVMIDVASDVVDGLVVGLESGVSSVAQASRALGQSIIDGMDGKAQEISDTYANVADELLKAFKSMSSVDLSKALESGASATLLSLADLHNKVVGYDSDTSNSRVAIEEKAAKKRLEIEELYQARKLALDDRFREEIEENERKALISKEKMDAYKLAGDEENFQLYRKAWMYYSRKPDDYKEELRVFENSREIELAVVEEYAAEQLKIAEETASKRLGYEKDYVEKMKSYNLLTLNDELALYQKFAQNYANDAEERAYYEQKILTVKKEINDKLVSINDTYVSKMQEANQKLIDGENALNKAYDDAVASRSQSLYSFAGIFDEIKEKSDVSGQQLISNLKGQVDTFKDWAANIASLASKGIDDGLLAELQAMGPSAAAEIAALNSLSATELTEYTALWQEKSALARTQAVTELEGMRVETEAQIEQLRKETSEQLEIYASEWQVAINGITNNTKTEFNDLANEMPTVGANVIKGMQQGLSSMTPALLAQANAIAQAIKSTIQSALDIHSPSRWGKKMIGHNLVKGIILGLSDMKSDAVKAAKELAEWVQPSVDVSEIINDISSAVDAIQTEIEHKVKVNVEIDGQPGKVGAGGGIVQNVEINSPKHLSPSETARHLKRVAQQLAWE